MILRYPRSANRYLDIRDKQHMYELHVNAMRTRGAYLDTTKPDVPTRITNHRVKSNYMARMTIKVANDNLRLLHRFEKNKTQLASSDPQQSANYQAPKVNWLKQISETKDTNSIISSRSHSQAGSYGKSELPPLKPVNGENRTKAKSLAGSIDKEDRKPANNNQQNQQQQDKQEEDKKVTIVIPDNVQNSNKEAEDTTLGNSGRRQRLETVVNDIEPV